MSSANSHESLRDQRLACISPLGNRLWLLSKAAGMSDSDIKILPVLSRFLCCCSEEAAWGFLQALLAS